MLTDSWYYDTELPWLEVCPLMLSSLDVQQHQSRLIVSCRLGANSMLQILPQVALKHILQLAEQPLVLNLYKIDRSSHIA